MRNIKTTLRYVRNSALLFAAASGMSYLTACQSENDITTPDNPDIPESTLKTASYSVYGPNQNRIRNYGTRSTRGDNDEKAVDFDMPACPAIPTDAKDLNADNNINNGTPAPGVYYVKKGDSLKSGLKLNNVTIYVEGELIIGDNFQTDGEGTGTIYVLEDGTLEFSHDWATIEPNMTIYNYGDLKGKGITVGNRAKVYSAVDITEVTEGFGINDPESTDSFGAVYCKGTIWSKKVRLNGEARACAFKADEEITINGNGTFRASYFEAPKMILHAGNVILDDNGLVKITTEDKTGQLFCSNADTRFTVEGTNAVIVADQFYTNNKDWPKSIFEAKIALGFDKAAVGNEYYSTPIDFNELEMQVSTSDRVVYVPFDEENCHSGYGERPGKPIIEIQKVTDIASHDHDHGTISATCINFGEANNTAYVSYHLRGNGDGEKNDNYVGNAQRGCIEVIKDNGEAGLELGSYMIAPDWDFNHLIVDEDRIVTVGNSKTMSAFIGTLPVDFEASTGIDRKVFEVKELTTNEPIYGPSKDDPNTQIRIGFKNAGDGNCVVRQGNYYYVATYEGYGPLNLDFTRVNDAEGNKIFKKTNGSAKHISLSGNNMAVIAHDTYDKPSSTASVFIYDASDFAFANKINTFDAVGTIEPVDGKNVIAMDGDQVYACLSKGGLVRVNDGKKWQKNNVPVNGMAFDDKYIYVANGSFVSVLDKATMEEICYYHASSKKSANYIALRNGKIYVAFGEDGLQVFELTEKTISE